MKQEERKDDGIIFSIRIRTGMVSMHAVYPYAYIKRHSKYLCATLLLIMFYS